LLPLDLGSEAELQEIGDASLIEIVDRVRADPSGRKEPQHPYTRKFRNPGKYANVGDRNVFEFKPSKWRGLFVIAAGENEGLFFVPIKGKRFMTLGECPWHKGK
jgi:hypothetical protein